MQVHTTATYILYVSLWPVVVVPAKIIPGEFYENRAAQALLAVEKKVRITQNLHNQFEPLC